MDSQHKHKVIDSYHLSGFGTSVTIMDVEHGYKTGMVLKSLSSGLYWEVQERILHSANEKRFADETEAFTHVNTRNIIDLKSLNENMKNNFEYRIKPIGHTQKPEHDDFLVFSATRAVWQPLKIIDIYEDYFLLDTENGNTGVLHKRYMLKKTAMIGDYVRYCEHGFHDLVDEQGNFIYR